MRGGAKTMNALCIREVTPEDRLDWLRMRDALWPDSEPPHASEIDRFFDGACRNPAAVLIAEVDDAAHGFAELSIRHYAEGCDTASVGYLEGLYVDPAYRHRGLARALVEHAQAWARKQGCTEFASDADIGNDVSATVHERLGFETVCDIRCFRKALT